MIKPYKVVHGGVGWMIEGPDAQPGSFSHKVNALHMAEGLNRAYRAARQADPSTKTPSYAALVNLFRIAAARKAANAPHDPKDPEANAHLQEYFIISDQYDAALALCEREAGHDVPELR